MRGDVDMLLVDLMLCILDVRFDLVVRWIAGFDLILDLDVRFDLVDLMLCILDVRFDSRCSMSSS